jgi:hypothetical protein
MSVSLSVPVCLCVCARVRVRVFGKAVNVTAQFKILDNFSSPNRGSRSHFPAYHHSRTSHFSQKDLGFTATMGTKIKFSTKISVQTQATNSIKCYSALFEN